MQYLLLKSMGCDSSHSGQEKSGKYCPECQRYVDIEDGKFCERCGSILIEKPCDTNETGASHEKMIFLKKKMIGYLVYKTTRTEVEIFEDYMNIQQSTKRFFRRERIERNSYPLERIRDAEIHTKLDFWDTFYAIVFALVGIKEIVVFCLAFLFLYTAYGKVIQINLYNGETFIIPFKEESESAQDLLQIIRGKN